MEIRKASKEDIPRLVELIKISDFRDEDWAFNRAKKYTSKKDRILIIAEEGHRLVGFIGLKIYEYNEETNKLVDLNTHAHVAWIAVLPEYRKEGIGLRLLDESDKYAKKWKKKGIWLDCKEKLIPFYSKNGYRIARNYLNEDNKRIIFVKDFF